MNNEKQWKIMEKLHNHVKSLEFSVIAPISGLAVLFNARKLL